MTAKSRSEIEAWLIGALATHLGLDAAQIDPKRPFSWYGLDSAAVIPMAGDLELWIGQDLSPTLLFEYPSIDELSAHLADAARRTVGPDGDGDGDGDGTKAEPPAAGPEPIAIVGIGCRFPRIAGPVAYWNMLCQGADLIAEVPPTRWDVDAYYDPDPQAPGKTISRWGGFIDDPDRFDAAFFGISPREATQMDPQQRLLLEVSWEALENAGVLPEKLAGSNTGVFVGISHSEYSDLQYGRPARIDAYAGTSNSLSIAANRLSYFFDLRGPSVSLDTACSSSLVAVHLACSSLRSGESEVALAAGVSLNFAPELSVVVTKAGIMSPDGRCKAFDAGANGYVRGEGCGVVVLKRLSRALADRDHVHAIIRGTAVLQDGRSNGLMAPNQTAQEAVVRTALARAEVTAADVSYVEAHGTGTSLGDAIEARALGAVLGAGRTAERPCLIGSVKTNLGHLEPAAGIAGLIKVALALEHGRIPPSLHFQQPNPEIDFDALRLRVNDALTAWPAGSDRRIAGVSSFGFGGTNAHAILEAPPPPPVAAATAGTAHLLPLSARSPEALARTAALCREFFETAPEGLSLADVSATAARLRVHYPHRLALVGDSPAQLAAQLERFGRDRSLRGLTVGSVVPEAARKLVLVFSGQGSQWAGMGRELLGFAACKRVIDRCDEIFAGLAGISVLTELTAGEPQSQLARTDVAQPAIFTLQVALAALWESWGIVPDAVIGHSVGEIAAARVAGVLSLEDAARLVAERGRVMHRGAGGGQMAAVGLPAREVEALLSPYAGRLAVAAINAPEATVVSGERAALDELLAGLHRRGIFVKPLGLDYAFHGPGMAELAGELRSLLEGVTPRQPTIPFFSTVLGDRVEGADLGPDYWVRNVAQPVRFADALVAAANAGHRFFLEVGGHPVLGRDIAACRRSAPVAPTVLASLRRGDPARQTLLSAVGSLWVHGFPLRWDEVTGDPTRTAAVPSSPWKKERFWLELDRSDDQPKLPSAGGHPVLGPHVELAHAPNAHVWQSSTSATLFRRSHDPDGQGVSLFSAPVVLETFLAAAESMGETRPFVLSELALVPPGGNGESSRLARGESSASGEELLDIQIHAVPQWAGKWSLGMSARAPEGPAGRGAWTSRSRAALLTGQPASDPRAWPNLASVQAACATVLSPHELFDAAAPAKQDGTLQMIKELRRSDEGLLAKLVLPDSRRREATAFVVHPRLLQAGLQLLTLLPEQPGQALSPGEAIVGLPLRVGAYGRAGSTLWAYAPLATRPDDGGGRLATLYLLDDEGKLIGELLDVGLREAAAAKAPANDLFLYRTTFEPATAPPVAFGGGRQWLVLCDQQGVGERLCEQLASRGDSCLRLFLDPADDSAAVASRVRASFEGADGPIHGLVHLWSLDAPTAAEPSAEQLGQAHRCGVLSALATVQGLSRSAVEPLPRVWFVTAGAQTMSEDPATGARIVQSPTWGLGLAVAFELPDLQPTVIDLDPDLPAAEQSRRLVEALASDPRERQLLVRGDGRYIPRLRVLDLPAAGPTGRRGSGVQNGGPTQPGPGRPAPAVSGDGTYLFSGGFGGIGLLLAESFVEKGARHLALLTRRAPSEVAAAALERMRAAGARVEVLQADVAIKAQVAAALAQVRATMPPLRGIVHAAGLLDPGPLLELDDQRMAAVLRPKVDGAQNLHDLTREDDLQLFALFSSAASVLGSPGQANYVAANTYLDALAQLRRRLGLPVLNINWGPWARVGLAAEFVDKMKQRSVSTERVNAPAQSVLASRLIAPARGLEIFWTLLEGAVSQAIVLPWDVATIVPYYPAGAAGSLFDEVCPPQRLPPAEIRTRVYERPLLKQEYIAPRGEAESIIARMWEQALGIEKVGVRDNFFELGGDSVMGAQLVTQVNKRFGLSLSLRDTFQTFTVEELAQRVEALLLRKLEQLSEEEAQRLLDGDEQQDGPAERQPERQTIPA